MHCCGCCRCPSETASPFPCTELPRMSARQCAPRDITLLTDSLPSLPIEVLTFDLKKTGDNHLVNGRLALQILGTNNASASASNPTSSPTNHLPVINIGSLEDSVRAVDISSATSSTTGTSPVSTMSQRPYMHNPPGPGPNQMGPGVGPPWSPPGGMGGPNGPLAFPTPHIAQRPASVIPAPPQPQPIQQPPPQHMHHPNPQPVSTIHGQGPTAGFSTHSDEFGPLPGGWERRQDHLGRNYYVDHNSRTTTWHRPSFNQGVNNVEQQAEATQARDHHNRRQLVDEAFGDGDSSNQVSRSASAMSHATSPQQPASADPLGGLPAGWEERRTPEGRVYFVDRKFSFDIFLGAKAK